jgi:phosphatidylglycerol:prolipoprotein diacylglycerol transferase
MHPVLLEIFGIKIYSYGTFVAIGFIFGLILAEKFAKKNNVDPQLISNLGIIILFSGIIGARILYVLVNLNYFFHKPIFEIFKIWEGGLVFYGGLIASIISGIIYLRKKKKDVLQIANIITPSIAIAHAIGRIGCFLNGCCYGKVSYKFGLIFPAIGDNLPHLPTQLIESFALIIFFFIVLFFIKKKFYAYLIYYSCFRFVIEFFRGDDRGVFFLNYFSISQFISALIILFIIYIYLKNKFF